MMHEMRISSHHPLMLMQVYNGPGLCDGVQVGFSDSVVGNYKPLI